MKAMRLAPLHYDITVEENYLHAPLLSLGDAMVSSPKTRFSMIATVSEVT